MSKVPRKVAERAQSSPKPKYRRPARPPVAMKKGNGEGSVYQEGLTGRWVAAISTDVRINGRATVIKRRAGSKSEAQELLRILQAEKHEGRLLDPSGVTVRAVAQEWTAQRGELRFSTRMRSEEHLEHALSVIGDRPIQKVKTGDINALMLLLSQKRMAHGRPMARVTLKHIRTHLMSVFGYALNVMEIIKKNPVTASTFIGDANPIGGRPLTTAQANRLCEIGAAFYAAGYLRLWPAVFTALNTGMRRGELFALTWDDVDLERCRITINKALNRAPSGYAVGLPKTSNSIRTIPITVEVCDLLRRHQKNQEAELRAQHIEWSRKLPVFGTQSGRMTSPDNLYRSLSCLQTWSDPDNLPEAEGRSSTWRGIELRHRPALIETVRAGEALPKFSPHDLRHTYATLMLMHRQPPEVVSKLLGHASVVITLTVYRKVLDAEIVAAGTINILASPDQP